MKKKHREVAKCPKCSYDVAPVMDSAGIAVVGFACPTCGCLDTIDKVAIMRVKIRERDCCQAHKKTGERPQHRCSKDKVDADCPKRLQEDEACLDKNPKK